MGQTKEKAKYPNGGLILIILSFVVLFFVMFIGVKFGYLPKEPRTLNWILNG